MSAKQEAKKSTTRTRGHIAKKGNRYYAVIDIPKHPAQRCMSCNTRYWLESKLKKNCAKCDGELQSTVERRQIWSEGFEKKGDADKQLTATLDARDKKELIVPTNETLAEYFERWFEVQQLRQLRPSTLHSYYRKFENYLAPRLGHVHLQDLNVSQLISAMPTF